MRETMVRVTRARTRRHPPRTVQVVVARLAGPAHGRDAGADGLDASPDWMYRCDETSVVRQLGSTRAIVYGRMSAPGPVWDRDVVLDVSYSYNFDTGPDWSRLIRS